MTNNELNGLVKPSDHKESLRNEYLGTAMQFLEKHSVPQTERASILNGIDFNRPVTVVKLNQGHILQRDERKGEDPAWHPSGCWLAEPGANATSLGVIDAGTETPHVDRQRDYFVVGTSVEVLHSTAKDFTEVTPNSKFNRSGLLLRGGETQYYCPRSSLECVERVVLSEQRSNGPIPESMRSSGDHARNELVGDGVPKIDPASERALLREQLRPTTEYRDAQLECERAKQLQQSERQQHDQERSHRH